jgi:hypothetical protein
LRELVKHNECGCVLLLSGVLWASAETIPSRLGCRVSLAVSGIGRRGLRFDRRVERGAATAPLGDREGVAVELEDG